MRGGLEPARHISQDGADQTTAQFPRGYGFLVDQIRRAALSISANIAEANGGSPTPTVKIPSALTEAQFRHAQGLLDLAQRRGLQTDSDRLALKAQLEKATRKLEGLSQGIENQPFSQFGCERSRLLSNSPFSQSQDALLRRRQPLLNLRGSPVASFQPTEHSRSRSFQATWYDCARVKA
ncbi:MAG TPA: hypothetical protein DDY91_10230 [Planctomycetaceae bacterium]|nr:hypothetical protein [Planctomycetaceae bacterium]